MKPHNRAICERPAGQGIARSGYAARAYPAARRPGSLFNEFTPRCFALLLLMPLTACSSSMNDLSLKPRPQVELVSYRDPYFPHRAQFDFDERCYRYDSGGDLHVAARRSTPAVSVDSGPVEELLHIHLFWKPIPGRTNTDPHSNNAVIRYLIHTPQGWALYGGTGFVFPSQRWDGKLDVQLETSGLKLVRESGTAPESLGVSRLTLQMSVAESPAAALALARDIDILTGVNED